MPWGNKKYLKTEPDFAYVQYDFKILEVINIHFMEE
jgi:hypothetical protein